jgi:hypothetical protein
MSRIVRKTSADPLSPEAVEQLKQLAQMPDDQINTDDIPERHFDVARFRQRVAEGWRPGVVTQKKAS